MNSALAKSEAVMNGFDEAVMLSAEGHVCEGSAENLFMVRRGVLYTPDPSQNILEGVTRRAVITLAREELGLHVVAEGVEDAATWKQLADARCDQVQGYYFARPMAADSLTRWLRASQERPATLAA